MMKISVIFAVLFIAFAGIAFCGTEDMEMEVFEPQNRDAASLFPVFEHLKSSEGKVTIDHRSNSLIVVDYPENLEKMTEIIKRLDIPPKQVEIKVIVTEVTSSFLARAGLNMGMSIITPKNFKRIEYLMENSEGASVRSEMSVKTFSGEPATLKIAQEEILWGVASMPESKVVTIAPVATRTAGNFLKVLPRVNEDNVITITLLPSVSEFQEDRSVYEKSIHTRVMIRSGDIITLGGLEESRRYTGQGRVPFTEMTLIEMAEEEGKKVLIFLTASVVE